jgi:hypothetical protein
MGWPRPLYMRFFAVNSVLTPRFTPTEGEKSFRASDGMVIEAFALATRKGCGTCGHADSTRAYREEHRPDNRRARRARLSTLPEDEATDHQDRTRNLHRPEQQRARQLHRPLRGQRRGLRVYRLRYGRGELARKHLVAVALLITTRRRTTTPPCCPSCFGGYVTITVEGDGNERNEAVLCRGCIR